MTKKTRQSGTTLIVLALIGTLYFWVSDPKFGPATRREPAYTWEPAWRVFGTRISMDPRHWLYMAQGSPDNPVDAAHTAQLSTFVGVAGCLVVLGIGSWLLTRRRV
jgi:hypothetical protein